MSESLTVKQVEWYSDGVFEIQFERNGIEFTPGDCLALYAGDDSTSRPYSVASGQQEDVLRFVIRRMPGGMVSTFLSERSPGDPVKVSPPFGWFRPGSVPGAPFVFVATGTGISPFLSHFRSRPTQAPALCLYGVREAADAVRPDWLAERCPLRLAVSQQEVAGAHHGRVTDLLGELPLNGAIHYYLCGLDAMIDEVTTWLEAREVPITHIHRECFFNAT